MDTIRVGAEVEGSNILAGEVKKATVVVACREGTAPNSHQCQSWHLLGKHRRFSQILKYNLLNFHLRG